MIPDSNIVDLVTNTMKTKSRKGFASPKGTDEFAQALKETKVPKDYIQNPNIIKAMEKPGKISTPRPMLTEYDDDYDDTGFQEASSFSTPQGSSFALTPKTTKRTKNAILDWSILKR